MANILDSSDIRRGAFYNTLVALLGSGQVFADPATRHSYSIDAYLESGVPDCVVFPKTTEQVSAVVRLSKDFNIPVTTRGAGSGYAGGAVANAGGVLIVMTHMNEILELDPVRRTAWVECGVITAHVNKAAAEYGLCYRPDPSSLSISTVGGNVATNAGGPHCLGYGVTSNHVLECEVVWSNGEVGRVGSSTSIASGLDIRGLVLGSEGTLCIVTKAKLQLFPIPRSVKTIYCSFPEATEAARFVEECFRLGAIPTALDMTCGVLRPEHGEITLDDETYIYIDVEGFAQDVEDLIQVLREISARFTCTIEVLTKSDLMAKRFLTTISRSRRTTALTGSNRYFLFDAVVPRSRLVDVLATLTRLSAEHNLPLAQTFHAGDGNIHPTPFFDSTDSTSISRLWSFWRDTLQMVRFYDGGLSGEHGIGLEKVKIMKDFYSRDTIRIMQGLRRLFDPAGLFNAGKTIPDSIDQQDESPTSVVEKSCLRVNIIDGYVEVGESVTFTQIRHALYDTPYEMCLEFAHEPAALTACDAINRGGIALRELGRGFGRDLLLEAVIENKRGKFIRCGSSFAKDVAGFDLRKLVYGSQGALGQVKSVKLRLTPRATCSKTMVAAFPSLSESLDFTNDIFALSVPSTLIAVRKKDSAHLAYILLEATTREVAESVSLIKSKFETLKIQTREGLLFSDLRFDKECECCEFDESMVPSLDGMSGDDAMILLGAGIIFRPRNSSDVNHGQVFSREANNAWDLGISNVFASI